MWRKTGDELYNDKEMNTDLINQGDEIEIEKIEMIDDKCLKNGLNVDVC